MFLLCNEVLPVDSAFFLALQLLWVDHLQVEISMELLNLLRSLLEHLSIGLHVIDYILVHLGNGAVLTKLGPLFGLHRHLRADHLVEILEGRVEGHLRVNFFLSFRSEVQRVDEVGSCLSLRIGRGNERWELVVP